MKNAKNLHVPLGLELHEELLDAAARLGKPATALARKAIEAYLMQLRREHTDQAVKMWAEEFAGTSLDFDPELEAAGVDCLTSQSNDA